MKSKTTLSLLLIFFINHIICQELDLSNINSLEKLKNHKTNTLENKKAEFHTLYYVYVNNAIWNGIKVTEAALFDDKITMTIPKTSLNGTKNAIKYIENLFKEELSKEISYSTTNYIVNNPEIYLNLEVDVDEDETVKANTTSNLKIVFKPTLTENFPNISKNITLNSKGIFYFLDLDHYQNDIEILINGIPIYKTSSKKQLVTQDENILLNSFILKNGNTNLEVIITPGNDENDQPYPLIQKKSFSSVVLKKGKYNSGVFNTLENNEFCKFKGYVTDTIQAKDGSTSYYSYMGNPNYGKKQLNCSINFNADVDYIVTGWENGKNLHEDQNLAKKITQLYEKLAKHISEKDKKALSDMFSQMGLEKTISQYNRNSSYVIDEWNSFLETMEFSNILKIEKDFDILISKDGKLAYATPKKQKNMLRAIGKKWATGFTYFIYADEKTGELKFIR